MFWDYSRTIQTEPLSLPNHHNHHHHHLKYFSVTFHTDVCPVQKCSSYCMSIITKYIPAVHFVNNKNDLIKGKLDTRDGEKFGYFTVNIIMKSTIFQQSRILNYVFISLLSLCCSYAIRSNKQCIHRKSGVTEGIGIMDHRLYFSFHSPKAYER